MKQIPRWVWVVMGAAVLVAVIVAWPRSAQSHFDRGNAYLEKGNVDAAILEFRNAVRKDPRLVPVRIKLGELYVKRGDGAAALAEFVRVADLQPEDADAQLKAGSLLLLAGRPEEAKARADKAMAINPKHADAMSLRASAMAGLGDFDGAIEQMRQALALDPSASRQAGLGMVLHKKGQAKEAEAAFRQAVAMEPESVLARLSLAQFLSETGRGGEAEPVFGAALALDPGNVAANRALAAFYVASNRAAEAEPYYRKVASASDDPAAKVALADYYVTVKRIADALAALEELSAAPRTWALARSRVAALLYSDGRTAEAHRAIDEVIAKQPAYSEARLIRGRMLLAEGKQDPALVDAQEAVQVDPRNADAHYLLASVQQARGDADAAAKSFAEVLRLNPGATAAQVNLAGIDLQRGRLISATEFAGEALRRDPNSLEARLILSRSLIARGELERAATVTRELQDAFPKVGAAHAQAGVLAMRRGDRAGARAAFEKALALDPNLVDPLTALAALDLAEGRGDRARARFEERLKRSPGDSAVLVGAATTWEASGDKGKAEEFLRRAIEADASNFDAYARLANLYVPQNKLDKALAEYDQLASRQPGAVGPPTMAGLLLEAQGKTEEARRRFEDIVERYPKAAVASNNLAWMYATRGEQLDRALQLAQAAWEQLPDQPDVNDTLGYVYIRRQLGSLAVPLLLHSLELRPEEPVFHYHLGLAYAQAGNEEAARQSMERALGLKADFEGADEARALLKK